MCATCGCSGEVEAGAREHGHAHPNAHGATLRAPLAAPGGARRVRFEQEVLGKNDRLAAQNRAWLAERGIVALNLVSSPGAGKTTLLERTIADLRTQVKLCVIEGDQETALDAERVRAAGCPAIQVNTGRGCHLDAASVGEAMRALDPPRGALLLVENVGNLVCPALFDLGERAKVVIVSTTEGEDKPLKYPHLFRASALMVLNKVDLLPHLRFDPEQSFAHARSVNPRLEVLAVSATRGDGLEGWYRWVRGHR